jgi:hypothetical protein
MKEIEPKVKKVKVVKKKSKNDRHYSYTIVYGEVIMSYD